jgi:hypothetical protein
MLSTSCIIWGPITEKTTIYVKGYAWIARSAYQPIQVSADDTEVITIMVK